VSALLPVIVSRIRERGPITIAEFMELALYHPEYGYYASASQRSGRGGDFYTSVDAGALFGETIAAQLDEMWQLVRAAGATHFDLVEAGAGNGRLARDIVDRAAAQHPDLYAHLRVTLVERSAAARARQHAIMGRHAFHSRDTIGPGITGVILANELLDALPVHSVTMTPTGLREIFVDEQDGTLGEVQRPLSSDAVAEYVSRMPQRLDVGSRVEAGLEAERWVESAARSLQLGFLLLFDYGHEAPELLSASHAGGTLMSYRAHSVCPDDFLRDPGARDLTSHINFTAVREAAERSGLVPLGSVDQTYFLTNLGIVARLDTGHDRGAVARRLAAKTLLLPGGLGSTMKVLAFCKGIGRPMLRGLSSGRLT
jgi:SAM-dependent MidA family methyltransferase